ncbi:hypothetical protein DSO57_1031355 [Entomophthora muscae]|uniref:Uncharacterized protein n=1 Tax=Entomophthora muscae TaxID=34485 RepID=A0ACC2RRL9_9FUNG|nr:hypothetical protein DSO57_1031355 [Entomophthora muscae]
MLGWIMVVASVIYLVVRIASLSIVSAPIRHFTAQRRRPFKEPKANWATITEVGVDVRRDHNVPGFFQFTLPGRCEAKFIWSGAPLSFIDYHSYQPPTNPYRISCEYLHSDKKTGGCFVKYMEGYNATSLIRSPPTTCNRPGLCYVSATFLVAPTTSDNFISPLTFEHLLSMSEIDPLRSIITQTEPFNQTITLSFEGPGTREIWFKPIFWSVTGIYRAIKPEDTNGIQVHVSLNFLLVVANQSDAMYSLVDPNI